MGLHVRFTAALGRLLKSWGRYQEAPRHPERIPELGAARADLEDARTDAAEARASYHPNWRREDAPETPPRKTSASDEEIAVLRLRGDGFGNR